MEDTVPVRWMAHDHPEPLTCPYCKQKISTRVAHVPGLLTWLMGILLVATVIFSCMAPIPFFIDFFKDAKHYCPNCNAFIGVYKRL